MALVALTFVAGMRIYQVHIGEMRARRIPVLCAVAIGAGHVPGRLPVFAWLFLFLRVVHSAIQCTYNKVVHRFPVFLAGLLSGDGHVGRICCFVPEGLTMREPIATPRRTFVIFLLSLGGALVGILLGPGIVAAFSGAPAWLLPVVMAASVLLSLVAGAVAFKLASRNRPG